MKTFTNEEVESYYDQTENHYRQFWKLDKNMSLHYGVWNDKTRNLSQAMDNTNKQLMLRAEINKEHRVLDAGCGVGGSSIYLAKNVGCRATGITLSKKQTLTAAEFAEKNGVSELVDFQQQDYTNTNFPDGSFDIAWGMESTSTATSKPALFKEMYRVLKPGGKFAVADFYKTRNFNLEEDKDLQIMLNGWAIADIGTLEEFLKDGEEAGFKLVSIEDYTKAIKKSVNVMYYAYLAGGWYSWLYNNIINRNVRPFARDHYKTARGQYKAYKKGLWCYHHMVFEKK